MKNASEPWKDHSRRTRQHASVLIHAIDWNTSCKSTTSEHKCKFMTIVQIQIIFITRAFDVDRWTGSNSTEAFVRFKVDSFLPLKRRVQFSRLEIVSFIGGLLGLFTGFSLLSFSEVFYFFLIQPFLKFLKRNQVEPLNSNKRSWWRQNILVTYLVESSIRSFNYIVTEKSKIAK
jgi:Amiloride-sensitive sodium channel